MNKLGSKEIFLILIIINFLLYYMAYMIVVSPMRKSSQELSDQIGTLQAQYDEQKSIVDQKESYIQQIDSLKAEKAELFANSFPDAETENIHAYLVDRAKESGIAINTVNLSQSVKKTRDEETGEEIPTGLKTNDISAEVTGSYTNIIKLITDIEGAKKTSLLTSLDLQGNPAQMTTSLNYTFLTVDKGDEIQDNTFDHNFNQAVNNEALFH